jgi:hypothetical protein
MGFNETPHYERTIIMDPLNPKAELFAFLITDENKDSLTKDYNSDDVMSATNLPGTPRTFVPGYYAVVRLISADDPFVKSLGNRFYSVWITSPSVFVSTFRIIGTDPIYRSRLQITLK